MGTRRVILPCVMPLKFYVPLYGVTSQPYTLEFGYGSEVYASKNATHSLQEFLAYIDGFMIPIRMRGGSGINPFLSIVTRAFMMYRIYRYKPKENK